MDHPIIHVDVHR